MITRPTNFRFKGARDYVQGPDIYNAIMECFSGHICGEIRFTVHGFISTPDCVIHISPDRKEIELVEGYFAECGLRIEGKEQWVRVVGDPGSRQRIEREEYDEASLIKMCDVQNNSISISGESPYSFAETIVSMNKHLHNHLFPEANGKWIFTRLDLVRFIDARTSVSLSFRHNFNFRLTRADVLLDEDKVADIYFSLVKV